MFDECPEYAELHCLSSFSFQRGASQPGELVARAVTLGYQALAITDECSLAGVVRAYEALKQHPIHLIVGTELTLADGLRVVLLAQDHDGYSNLCEIITVGRRAAKKGAYRLGRSDLEHRTRGCLALWLPGDTIDPTEGLWLSQCYPERAYLAVEMHCHQQDSHRLRDLLATAEEIPLAPIAAGDVHMHRRGRRALQDALTAIRLGTTVGALGPKGFANGERHLRSRQALACRYPPPLLAQTVAAARRCTFTLDELRYEYPHELVPEGFTAAAWLRGLTERGMRRRWPEGIKAEVRQQIDHELELIAELNYEPYFLTVHDVVRYARRQGILCQGRGSAANSAVCYCLGITEVDPARMKMLFERFISRERNEPPDIDVDFEHERREEVIQYIYNKYGRARAALAATVISYRPRSAVRDLGKALGLDLEQVDRLAKALNWWDDLDALKQRLTERGFDPDAPVIGRLLTLVDQVLGFPRHLSQHVGGFVISEHPLSQLVPVENAAMPERTIIQWDKDDLETLGLLKVDCLALGMLTALHRGFDLINAFYGLEYTIGNIPPEEPEVYQMIQRADTVGVFQIESRAQMSMLPRLKPECYYDLVIEVAIVRPGPIQGKMVHPYLRRRSGEEDVTYPSEALKAVFERTLGVPIFQEQVMQLAVVAAGFSPGEADQLRRSMAAWRRRGGLEYFRGRIMRGMRERGYDQAFAERVFQQIKGFGSYGFPESHAASFALLVYVSCWMKHHYPAAFCCALLNSQPMGFYRPAQLVQDAQRHGVEVRPPDVCYSDWDSTLETGHDGEPVLRLGLREVKGMQEESAQAITQARAAKPFPNVNDLIRRAELNRHQRAVLADADALATLAGHRHQARWAVQGVEDLPPLLATATIRDEHAELRTPTAGEDVLADYRTLGLSLKHHPLALLRPRLHAERFLTAQALTALPHKRRARGAGLITLRQRPETAAGVIFMTLEDETGMINLVIWRDLAVRQRREILESRLLGVDGVIEREGIVCHFIAHRVRNYDHLIGELSVPARNFH